MSQTASCAPMGTGRIDLAKKTIVTDLKKAFPAASRYLKKVCDYLAPVLPKIKYEVSLTGVFGGLALALGKALSDGGDALDPSLGSQASAVIMPVVVFEKDPRTLSFQDLTGMSLAPRGL